MQKSITYEMNRVIDTVKINEELVAYSDKLYRNGELVEEIEGIALSKTIEEIELDQHIQNYKANVREGVKCVIGLFNKGIQEAVRTILFGSDKAIGEYKKYYLENPYSYVKEFGMNEDVRLMYLSYYDHNLYDEQFVVQPKAMHFDYIQAHMNNRCYDLEQVIEVLTKRNDIEWINERYYRGEGVEIKTIPYYNREEWCDRYLEFIWRPTEEDFETIRKDITNTYSRYDSVCEKVFGLTKLHAY